MALKGAHTPLTWPEAQQTRYVGACIRARATDPSLNQKVCECDLEIVMQKFGSIDEYARYLASHKDEGPEPDLAGWFDRCSAAFGD
jgi:hypothetical protein